MKQLLMILLCFQIGIIFSQEDNREEIEAEANQFVAAGNEVLIKDGNFPKAEGEYRKAIAKNPVNPTAKYNLANAYYNTEKYDEASQRYTEAVKTASSKAEKHKAFHNQGNTYMEQKKYKEAVEAYKSALRNNPKDDETRYNLALAKQKKEEQQKQDDQNKDNKDNKDDNKDQKDQNKDKEGEDKEDKKEDKKEGEDDKEKKRDEGEDKKDEKGEDKKDEKGDPKDEGKDKQEDKKEGEGKPEEQQPQQVQGQLSPQQVKSLLEAMNNEEKKVQDKINAKKAKGAKTRTEKDW